MNPPDDQRLLREGEEKYRALIETTGTGYVIIDSEGRVLDANREYIRLSGHEALEEILGRRVTEWTAPHDLARNAEEVGKCMERGFVHNLEIDYVNKEGKFTPVEMNATVLPMAEGTRIVTLCRDISERKRVEEKLKASEERFRTASESLTDVVYEWDLKEKLDWFGDVDGLMGYPAGGFPRTIDGWAAAIHPEDQDRIKGAIEGQLKRAAPYNVEYRVRKKDGEWRWWSARGTALRDERGEPYKWIGAITDVTERKRVEEDLRESEGKWHSLVTNAPDIIMNVDRGGQILFINRTVPGFRVEDTIGKSVFDFTSPENHDEIKRSIEKVFNTGEIREFETKGDGDDGKPAWYATRVGPIKNAGEVVSVLFDSTDITVRKRVEEALQESEQRFKGIFDHSNDGIILADTETKRFFIGNETVCRMLGYSPDEIKDLGVTDIHPPEDLPHVIDQFEKQARKEIDVAKDLPVARKDGSIFFADVNSFPITLADKTYLVGAFRDTSERKLAEELLREQKEELEAANEDLRISEEDLATQLEELQQSRDALRESEGKHRTLLENLPQTIFFKDRNLAYISCNENYARDLKIRSDEIRGRTDYDFYPRDLAEKYRSDDRRILESGRPEEFEERYLQEGQERWVHTIKTPVKNEAGEVIGVLGIFRDITERKNLEAQLIQAQKMEAVGLLAGGIAHEFNNILGGILGYASLMRLKMEPDHPFWRYVETIEKSSQRAAVLTSQLLGFARKGKYDLRLLSLNLLAEDTLAIVRQTFDRAVTVEARLAESLPNVEGDTMQLQQVLMNLCINARDAMPQGGSLVLTTGTEQVAEGDERIPPESKAGLYVLLSVADTGCGMDEETQAKIFEPFFTTKEKGKGTGLGLAMVYGVAKNHGGFVTVRSEVGRGSAFTLHLPAAEKPSERRPEALAAPEKSRGAVPDQTILVVDDEESIRFLARDILEGEGYRVLLAEDGPQALEAYREHQGEIGLVVLDLIMPKLGGEEVFLKLKEMNPGVQVLVSSGYSQEGKAEEILSGGALGFVQKPFHVRDLVTQVRQGLDGKEG